MECFDLQINGYGGVDFNQDNLGQEELHIACKLLRAHGLHGILATIISDSIEKMAVRIQRLVLLRAQDPLVQATIWGIHVEGPFLNPKKGYRGAHPLHAIRKADVESAGRLIEAGDGLVRLFTLAPERDPKAKVITFLGRHEVTVSAGHTDAKTDELKCAIDAGLSMFTHLGNGCPLSMPRHDNIIQRVLSLRNHLWISFIADGIHIPFFALRNYFDLIQPDRIIATTDAMSAAGLGPGCYRLGPWEVAVGPDLVARSPDGSHFLGSAVSMPALIENLRLQLNLADAVISGAIGTNALNALNFGAAESESSSVTHADDLSKIYAS